MIILFIAVVLDTISFILPLWSTSDVVNESLKNDVVKADFAAGVWGYCTDVELTNSTSKNSTLAFDHCYFFHTSNDYEMPTVDEEWKDNFAKFSVCDGYSQAESYGSTALKAYTSGLALVAGMDSTQFEVFLRKSCSALGSATLVFASLASSTGSLAFIGVVLGVTCCKNKSSFNAAVKVLISFAFVTNVLTFALWLFQSHALNKADDVSLSGSFVLNVLSAILYLVAGALLGRHNMMKA